MVVEKGRIQQGQSYRQYDVRSVTLRPALMEAISKITQPQLSQLRPYERIVGGLSKEGEGRNLWVRRTRREEVRGRKLGKVRRGSID